jgi:trimethylamine---corrinoid protein Co-methyltransferase
MIRNPRAGARKSGGFRLEVFTEDELLEIHSATLEVLSRTGVFVEDDEALQIFADAGADIDRERRVVRLPAHLVDDAIRSAPSKVVMCGRDPARDVVLEDGRVGFTNFGEGIQVVDPYTGELHASRKQDVADCTKIIDALPEIDVVERPLGAHDAPPDTAALHNAEAIFSNTTKHATIGPLTGFCARKMIDMAAAIVGGHEELRRRPILSFLTCPVSPLKLVADACRIIIEGVRAGIPVNVLSMAMAGGSSPVSLAGTLVTHNAEVLAGITLAQLTVKGATVIYGSSTTAMDLRFASASVGSPECGMIGAGVACLARFYLLPSWVAGA